MIASTAIVPAVCPCCGRAAAKPVELFPLPQRMERSADGTRVRRADGGWVTIA